MQRLRIKYSKEEPIKYISHLDLIRLWERALRRTGIPISYSKGFNPKSQISFGPPLAVGYTSQSEYLDLFLEKWTKPELAKIEINSKLPNGIKILEVKIISPKESSLTSQIKQAEYIVEIESENNLAEEIEKIMNTKELIITKKRKDGTEKKIDIRPMIYELEAINNHQLKMILQCNSSATLRPNELLNLLGSTKISRIHRVEFIF